MDQALSEALGQHRAGQLSAAAALYQVVLARAPEHPQANFFLALLHMQSQRPAEALGCLRKAWSAMPGHEQVATLQLECLVLLDRQTEAEAFLAEVQGRYAFQGADYLRQAHRVREIAAGNYPPATQIQRILDLYSNARWDALAAQLPALMERWPNWALGWAVLGAIEAQRADASVLAPLPAHAGMHMPGEHPRRVVQGAATGQEPRQASAEHHLARALALNPQLALAHEHLLRVKFERHAAMSELQPHLDGLGIGPGASMRLPLTSVREHCQRGGGSWVAHAEPAVIHVEAPACLGGRFDVEAAIGTTTANTPYTATLHGATFFVRHDFLVAAGQVLYDQLQHPLGSALDTSREKMILARNDTELLLDLRARQLLEVDAAIPLTGVASHEYGHWMLDYLPRIRTLEKHPEFHRTPIYIDRTMPPSHAQALRLVVGEAQRIVEVEHQAAVEARQLIVAPASTFFPYVCKHGTPASVHLGAVDPEDLAFLRARMLRALSLDPERRADGSGRRLFLRRQGSLRSLLNQDEIEELLVTRHGFESVRPETLSLREQVALFAEADHIFGPNSSAFCNVIFAPRGAQVCSFVQAYAANFPAWSHAVCQLGMRHLYVAGEAVPDSAWHPHHNDYTVPIRWIEEALACSGLG